MPCALAHTQLRVRFLPFRTRCPLPVAKALKRHSGNLLLLLTSTPTHRRNSLCEPLLALRVSLCLRGLVLLHPLAQCDAYQMFVRARKKRLISARLVDFRKSPHNVTASPRGCSKVFDHATHPVKDQDHRDIQLELPRGGDIQSS